MATLQARLARGDQAAFAELYDAYADRVGHYLLVRLGPRADADDALQETLCRLARSRHKLARVADLDAYVLAVARTGNPSSTAKGPRSVGRGNSSLSRLKAAPRVNSPRGRAI
jgi:hypothetical protein